MVADPVKATMETLLYYYKESGQFIDRQTSKLNETLDSFSIGDTITLKEPTRWERIVNNLHANKVSYGLGLGLISSSLIYCYFRKTDPIKRRVPKLPNGARRDVILIIGSPTQPLTRLLCLDLEKRGFIVYLTLLDLKDIKYIELNTITEDLNYLNLVDSSNSDSSPDSLTSLKSSSSPLSSNFIESQLDIFSKLFSRQIIPFTGADPHNLSLRGVVFAPSSYFPIGPLENVSIASWNLLNSRFSLYLLVLSSGLIHLIRSQSSKTLLINNSITSDLKLPFHAPENIFNSQLSSLFTTLSRELRQLNLSVTQIKLGNLHLSNQKSKPSTIINSELSTWPAELRSLYSTSFSKSIKSTSITKGTNLKELYHTVFDLIYAKKRNPPIVYCGLGARFYNFISTIIPDFLLEMIVA